MNETTTIVGIHHAGRIYAEEAATMLGFKKHDIPVLVSKKLLKPLGKPAQNAPKYFATSDILVKAQDIEWLNAASKATTDHWKVKNSRKASAQVGKAGSQIFEERK